MVECSWMDLIVLTCNDGLTDRWMDGWMDGWINRQMDGRMIEHQF